MGIVISIDAGTTGVRSFAVDESGSPLGFAYREFTQYFPQPGWVEHDAEEIWQAVLGTLTELTTSLDQPIAAIGITDQRETVVLWDKRTGVPRHKAIVWQDRRTAARCEQLESDGHLDLVRSTTGLVLDPYFSGSKFEWLLSEGRRERRTPCVRHHRLMAGLEAHGRGAHHRHHQRQSHALVRHPEHAVERRDVALFNVPMSALPEVRPSSGRFGVTTADLPIPSGVPVSGIAGDQQAALFGQAALRLVKRRTPTAPAPSCS